VCLGKHGVDGDEAGVGGDGHENEAGVGGDGGVQPVHDSSLIWQ